MSKNLAYNTKQSKLTEIDVELMNVLETAAAMMKDGDTSENTISYRQMFSEEVKKILDKNQVK